MDLQGFQHVCSSQCLTRSYTLDCCSETVLCFSFGENLPGLVTRNLRILLLSTSFPLRSSFLDLVSAIMLLVFSVLTERLTSWYWSTSPAAFLLSQPEISPMSLLSKAGVVL
ncbi:hypothetical protein GOODEAATRI_034620 [Goodea atripinnis]|uniref:Uncharacterized protein n=1 Tax=Goodea atripinnis TaxID=208336 RepID=A0ABV0MNK4_9TELE